MASSPLIHHGVGSATLVSSRRSAERPERRVVYGVPAGQAGACTSSYAILTDRDLDGWPPVPDVTSGVLADDCLAALRRPKGPGRPLVG